MAEMMTWCRKATTPVVIIYEPLAYLFDFFFLFISSKLCEGRKKESQHGFECLRNTCEVVSSQTPSFKRRSREG